MNEDRAEKLSIWNVNILKMVREVAANVRISELEVSPDGKFLAATTERGALVWRLPALMAFSP